MKKIIYALGVSVLFFSACKEKEIVIPELSVGTRRILVEEVTGVNCPNCPDGARELAALQQQFGEENLIIVAIHAGGILSAPISGSKYDFQTPEGYDLATYIGELFAVPSAAISRRIFANEDSEFQPFTSPWSSNITNEFKVDYKLGLFVANEYDPASRKLDIKVNIAPEVTIPGDHRMTVLITQDSIIDAQDDNSVIYPNYVHRHVFRDILSRIDGDPIAEPLKASDLISKNYSITLPATWDAKHCTVVAYVHNSGTPNKVVLQAAEAHVE